MFHDETLVGNNVSHKNVSQFAHTGNHDKTFTGNNVFSIMFPSLPRALNQAKKS